MNKQGFTLLEVSLFFAVSGLLALVAFAGLGPRLRNVRFTDAVRSLESTTQKQLSDFQSGVNVRGSNVHCSKQGGGVISITDDDTVPQAPGQAADCIINGRLAVFEEGQVVFYPVVSLRKQQTPCTNDSDYGKIFCYKPHIINVASTAQAIEYRNGAKRTKPNIDVKVLYIQDPEGTRTQLMRYTNIAPLNSNSVAINLGGANNDIEQIDTDNPAELCLGLSGRVAQISYTSSRLQPEVSFEGEGCST